MHVAIRNKAEATMKLVCNTESSEQPAATRNKPLGIYAGTGWGIWSKNLLVYKINSQVEHMYFLCMYTYAYMHAFIYTFFLYKIFFSSLYLILVEEYCYCNFTGKEGGWNRKWN